MLTSEILLTDGRRVVKPTVSVLTRDQARQVCEAIYNAGISGAVTENHKRNREQCLRDYFTHYKPKSCEAAADDILGRNTDPSRRRQAIDGCKREQERDFRTNIAGYRQFLEFEGLKSADDLRLFLQKYRSSDPLTLVPETRKRLAAYCKTLPATASVSVNELNAWLNGFAVLEPEYCTNELNSVRSMIAQKKMSEQRAVLERLGDVASIDRFLSQERSNLLPEIVTIATQKRNLIRDDTHTRQLSQLKNWKQVDAFLESAGSDISDQNRLNALGIREADTKRVIAEGGFDDLLELAHRGDHVARMRAQTVATNDSQLEILEKNVSGTTVEDLRDAIKRKRVRYANNLMDHLGQSGAEIDEKLKRSYLALLWSHGPFDIVFPLAEGGDRNALRRAYDIAQPGREQMLVENKIIADISSKLLVYSIVLKGDGKVKSEDVDAWIARKVDSTVTSPVSYEMSFDTDIFRPLRDYRVQVEVQLTVRGVLNGERACGLLWMSRCPVKDEAAVREYKTTISSILGSGNNYKTSGRTEIQWKSVSGGTGLASGSYFGGAMIFKATDLSIDAKTTSLVQIP